MKRILVTGGHSHVCRAVSETLVSCYSVLEVPSDSHALGAASLDRIRQSEADILVYAGGGALSSWDLQVGRTTEKNSLVALADLADERQMRVIMISSDRVFGGPVLFHDDDSNCFATSPDSKRLLRHESLVQSLNDSLVVRTNIVDSGRAEDSFCNRIMSSLELEQQLAVDASAFSTPISLDSFCRCLFKVIQNNVSGVVNIGGAERTTPFHFATQLARQAGFNPQLIEPASSLLREQSLRCRKLREIGLAPPLLRETIEAINVGVDSVELAAA